MGVAEIIGFAACWMIVASLMLWGVFTEHHRGEAFPPRRTPRRRRTDRVDPLEGGNPARDTNQPGGVPETDGPDRAGRRWLRTTHPAVPGRPGPEWHPSRFGRPADEWVVAEQADGGTPDVAERVRFLAGAWLAMRGVDIDALHPDDIRLEVTTNGEGVSTTRILVRARALHASRWRR